MMYDASPLSLSAVLSDMGPRACYRAIRLEDGRYMDVRTHRAYASVADWLDACEDHYIYAATAADALDGREA